MKKMGKYLGVIAFAAIIGFLMVACDNGTTGGNNPPGDGGYVTINNIPADFNGGFAILGFSNLFPFYIGAANINPNTLNITLLPISNRSVRLPMWELDVTYEDDYSYDFTIEAVTRLTLSGTPGSEPVLVIYSQSSLRVPVLWGEAGTGTVRTARYWSGITFTNGNATLCWNDSIGFDW